MRNSKTPMLARLVALVAVSLAASARPAAAEIQLRWTQPPDSPPVVAFRVYKGAATSAGELVYEGLPAPDASGVRAALVSIEEIDLGIPVYVWVTALNDAGESAPSNARIYPEACDPSVDGDCDGVPDDEDNCPFEPNPDQADVGGVRAGSAPDGIGTACQCGDVNGDGFVSSADGIIIGRALLTPPTATMLHPERCNVGGSAFCTTTDYRIVMRAQVKATGSGVAQICEPALAP